MTNVASQSRWSGSTGDINPEDYTDSQGRIQISKLPPELQEAIAGWGGRVKIGGKIYGALNGYLYAGGVYPGSQQPGGSGDVAGGSVPVHDYTMHSGMDEGQSDNESTDGPSSNLGDAEDLLGEEDDEFAPDALDLDSPDQDPPEAEPEKDIMFERGFDWNKYNQLAEETETDENRVISNPTPEQLDSLKNSYGGMFVDVNGSRYREEDGQLIRMGPVPVAGAPYTGWEPRSEGIGEMFPELNAHVDDLINLSGGQMDQLDRFGMDAYGKLPGGMPGSKVYVPGGKTFNPLKWYRRDGAYGAYDQDSEWDKYPTQRGSDQTVTATPMEYEALKKNGWFAKIDRTGKSAAVFAIGEDGRIVDLGYTGRYGGNNPNNPNDKTVNIEEMYTRAMRLIQNVGFNKVMPAEYNIDSLWDPVTNLPREGARSPLDPLGRSWDHWEKEKDGGEQDLNPKRVPGTGPKENRGGDNSDIDEKRNFGQGGQQSTKVADASGDTAFPAYELMANTLVESREAAKEDDVANGNGGLGANGDVASNRRNRAVGGGTPTSTWTPPDGDLPPGGQRPRGGFTMEEQVEPGESGNWGPDEEEDNRDYNRLADDIIADIKASPTGAWRGSGGVEDFIITQPIFKAGTEDVKIVGRPDGAYGGEELAGRLRFSELPPEAQQKVTEYLYSDEYEGLVTKARETAQLNSGNFYRRSEDGRVVPKPPNATGDPNATWSPYKEDWEPTKEWVDETNRVQKEIAEEQSGLGNPPPSPSHVWDDESREWVLPRNDQSYPVDFVDNEEDDGEVNVEYPVDTYEDSEVDVDNEEDDGEVNVEYPVDIYEKEEDSEEDDGEVNVEYPGNVVVTGHQDYTDDTKYYTGPGGQRFPIPPNNTGDLNAVFNRETFIWEVPGSGFEQNDQGGEPNWRAIEQGILGEIIHGDPSRFFPGNIDSYVYTGSDGIARPFSTLPPDLQNTIRTQFLSHPSYIQRATEYARSNMPEGWDDTWVLNPLTYQWEPPGSQRSDDLGDGAESDDLGDGVDLNDGLGDGDEWSGTGVSRGEGWFQGNFTERPNETALWDASTGLWETPAAAPAVDRQEVEFPVFDSGDGESSYTNGNEYTPDISPGASGDVTGGGFTNMDLVDQSGRAASDLIAKGGLSSEEQRAILENKTAPYYDQAEIDMDRILHKHIAGGTYTGGMLDSETENYLTGFRRDLATDVYLPWLEGRESSQRENIRLGADVGGEGFRLGQESDQQRFNQRMEEADMMGFLPEAEITLNDLGFDLRDYQSEDGVTSPAQSEKWRTDLPAINENFRARMGRDMTDSEAQRFLSGGSIVTSQPTASRYASEEEIKQGREQLSQGAQELILAEGRLNVDQSLAVYKEWEVRGFTDTGERIGVWLRHQSDQDYEALMRSGGTYYLRDNQGNPIIDPAKAHLVGPGYTASDTWKSMEIVGTDQLADQQFQRDELKRNGYVRPTMYADENGVMQVLYDEEGSPIIERVYGTDEMDRLDRERDDEWEKSKYTGFWSETNQGHPVWVEGAVGIAGLERQLQRDLREMGYDHETSERKAKEVYQSKVREGYRVWDEFARTYREIRGTQSQEEYSLRLQNELGIDRAEAMRRIENEARTGYEQVIEVPYTNPDGTVSMVTKVQHVAGTDELDYLQKTKFEELSAEWKLRVLNGYEKPILNDDGTPVMVDGKPATERIEGTYYTEAKIRRMAQDHDVDVLYVKAVIDRATEDSIVLKGGYITSRARQIIDEGGADTMEAARTLAEQELKDYGLDDLGVTLAERLAALDLAAADKRFEANKNVAIMTAGIKAATAVGNSLGPALFTLFFGEDAREGSGGWKSLIFNSAGQPVVPSVVDLLGWAQRQSVDLTEVEAVELRNKLLSTPAFFATTQEEAIAMGNSQMRTGLLAQFGSFLTAGKLSGASATIAGTAATLAIAYGAYKGYKWITKTPDYGPNVENNTQEWRASMVDKWAEGLTEDQESEFRTWAALQDKDLHDNDGGLRRTTHDVEVKFETKIHSIAGQSASLIATTAPLYRSLFDSGAFSIADIGMMTAGSANTVDNIWKSLPKNARAKHAFSETTLEERLDDVREFGNAMNIMTAEDAGKTLDAMRLRLEDPSQLTVDDRTNINQIIEQWGLYDELLKLHEGHQYELVEELVDGMRGTGFNQPSGEDNQERFKNGDIKDAVNNNNVFMTLPDKARLIMFFAEKGAIFDPNAMVNLDSLGLGQFNPMFRDWDSISNQPSDEDNRHYDANNDGVINTLDIPIIQEQVHEAFEEFTGRPLTAQEFRAMTELNGYAYRYHHGD